jgi:hypothetical protein
MPSKQTVDAILDAGVLRRTRQVGGGWELAIAYMRHVRLSLRERIAEGDDSLLLEIELLDQAIVEAVRAELARRSVQ